MKLKWKLLIVFGGIFILIMASLLFKSPQSQSSLSNIKSNILNAFSEGTISPIRTQYNGNYKVKSATGNESLYDVTFNKTQVSLGNITYYDEKLKKNVSVEQFREDTIICLEAGWDDKKIVSYFYDINETIIGVDKNYTYPVPSTLSFYKTDLLSKQSDLTKTKDNEISATSPTNPNKFCYQANPEKDFYLKFGDNSVIVIQGKDIVGDSLLTNVTAETGDANFTHLNISTTAPYDDLVGYWSFDGDNVNSKLNTSYDFSKENNDGTMVNDAVVNSSNCLSDFGDCLQLDGVSDYVNYGDKPVLSIVGPITMAAWIYPVAYGETYHAVIRKGSSVNDDSGYGFYIQSDGAVRGHGGDSQPFVDTSVVVGSWYHIVVTFDGTDAHLYINGTFIETRVAIAAPNSTTAANLHIGTRSDGTSYDWNGLIDEVMIFNTNLSAQQISDIYNNQSARFVKEGTQRVRAVNITNTTTWDNAGNNRVNLTTTYESNMNSNLSARIGQMNLSVDPDGLVLFMPFEWGSAVDISGGGNDGALNGFSGIAGSQWNETGGLNETGGFEFDGVSDYIDVGVQPELSFGNTSNFSISAWFKTELIAPAVFMIAGTRSGSTLGYGLQLTASNNRLEFNYFNGDTNPSLRSTVTVNDDVWHHAFVVWTADNSRREIWVDGNLIDSTASSSDTGNSSGEPFTIGALSSNPDLNEWNGSIDEVMIFNRTLSATEISQMFNDSVLKYNIAYYTDYQNLSGTLNVFNISADADFIFPDFNFLAGQNSSNPFYTPLLIGDITLEDWNFTAAPVGDVTAPNVTINTPANTTFTTNSIDFNVTALDETSMTDGGCWVTIDLGIINLTLQNTTVNDDYNATNATVPDGGYKAQFYCNDTENNINNSETQDFLVDTIFPEITIALPSNNTNSSNTALDINYTYAELNCDSTWYSNDTLTANTTLGCGTNITTVTWAEGNHNVTVWINDTGNQLNSTIVFFTTDTIPPDINITFPTNLTVSADNVLNVNYTTSDALTEVDSCWFSNDSYSANTTLASCTNITTVTWAEGQHNVTVWTNDSLNNVNRSDVRFTIDTIVLNINFTDPTLSNNTINNQDFIQINVTAEDGGSPLDTINVTVYDSSSNLINTTTSTTSPYFVTVNSLDPGLYFINATANDTLGRTNSTETRQIRLIKNVSMFHANFNVSEIIFNSDTYITILNSTVNLTTAEHITVKGIGALRKTTGATTNTLFLRLTVNEIVLFDSQIRSVQGTTDRGVFNLPMNDTLGVVGTNNITIEAREEGPQAINISNLEIHIDTDMSNHNQIVNHSHSIDSLNFTSTSFTNIKNFTLEKSFNSTSIIDIAHIVGTSGASTKDVTCYAQNNETNEQTPEYTRFLSGTADTGSTGIQFKSNISQTNDETWQLFCKSSVAEAILNNITFHSFSLVDALQNQIGAFQNQTLALQTITGNNNLITQFENYQVKNGTQIELVGTVIIQSTSGAQTSDNSPRIYINSSTTAESDCFNSYQRSLTDNNDIGTIKLYVNCNTLSPGETHTFNIYADVSGGETLTILNTSLSGYEVEVLDTTTGIVPPTVGIFNPTTGENLSGNIFVNATVSDPSNQGWASNVSFLNTDLTFNTTIHDDAGVNNNQSNATFDTSTISDGNYIIEWNVTGVAGTNLDRVNITIDNTNPDINIVYPQNLSNTTNSALDVNYTASDANIDSCWWTEDIGVTNNSLASCTTNITGQTWTEGLNNITVYVNDSVNNQNQSDISFTLDTTPPYFDEAIINQSILSNESLIYDINASDDGVGFDSYAIDDTTNFTINIGTGIITNATNLSVGLYPINITINDTLNNINSTLWSVNVTAAVPPDTTPPTFDEALQNQTLVYNNALFYDINASDETLFDSFTVNDTTNFKINISTGVLENNTVLGVMEYLINITINDSSDNLNSSMIIINITQATPTITKTLNGVDDNLSVVYPQQINATASTDFGTLNFTRDGVDATSENGLNVTLGVANYYYEFNVTGNQNYSNVSESLYANVTIATGLIYLYLNNSRANLTIDNSTNIWVNASLQTGVGDIQIYDNETLMNNGSSPLSNYTNWTAVGLRNMTAYYSGNTNYSASSETWWVNVTEEIVDTTPPTITNPRNFTQAANLSFSEDMSATDDSGISAYRLNDTTYFNISGAGIIVNVTNLSRIEIHWLNYSVNDTLNNVENLIFYINITSISLALPPSNITRIFPSVTNQVPYIKLGEALDFT